MEQQKVYIGNLSYNTNEDTLRNAFSEFGEVTEARLIKDKYTGKSKGFAFVTFTTKEQANAALRLDGSSLDGRTIKVSIAKPQEEKQQRSGGGSSSGGYHQRNNNSNSSGRSRW